MPCPMMRQVEKDRGRGARLKVCRQDGAELKKARDKYKALLDRYHEKVRR